MITPISPTDGLDDLIDHGHEHRLFKSKIFNLKDQNEKLLREVFRIEEERKRLLAHIAEIRATVADHVKAHVSDRVNELMEQVRVLRIQKDLQAKQASRARAETKKMRTYLPKGG
jgi:hypothetical protein